jgi:hypothetical protein
MVSAKCVTVKATPPTIVQHKRFIVVLQIALINAYLAPNTMHWMYLPVYQETVNVLTGNFVGDSVISNPAVIICSHKNIKAQLPSSVIVEKFVPGTCGN